MTFNPQLIERIRSQFPRVESDTEGRRIFFDNGAGSLVLKKAVDAEILSRVDYGPNKGAIYLESKQNEAAISEGRKAIADLLNAPSPSTIVQGESASDLFFKLSFALGDKLEKEDNVVTTWYEHYANITPYVELQKKGNIREVRFAELNDDGTLDMESLRGLVDKKTKVVAIAASSNLLGSKSPLREISRIAHDVGAYVVVDAVHHVPQGPMDVQDSDVDFLVFSGYKFFGPHASYMYIKDRIFGELNPFHVDPNAVSNAVPSRYELGTRDHTKFAAMNAVIEYLVWLSDQVDDQYKGRYSNFRGRARSLKVAMDAIEEYGRYLSELMLKGTDGSKGLTQLRNVKVHGITDPDHVEERDPTFSFKIKDMDDREIAERLWKDFRIASRFGHFWNNAQDYYKIPSMTRVTLLHYNTADEVHSFLNAVAEISGE